MSHNRFNRRSFLRGAGLSLAVPFLPSLLRSPHAQAQQEAGVRRLLVIGTRYGWDQESWFPTPEAVQAAQPMGERGRSMPLADIVGDPSTIHRRDIWGSLMDKMVLLDGFDARYSSGHDSHTALIGGPGELVDLPTESLDVIMRDQSSLPDGVPMPALNLATNPTTHEGTAMSVANAGGTMAYVPNLSDPAAAFDEIFSHVVDDAAAIEAFERRKRRDLSVIDHVYGDYERTRSNARLSQVDRARMEAYLQYLREYETSVAASEPVVCVTPDRPAELGQQANVALDHPERAEAQIANLVGALRCGVTNLATLWLMPSTPKYAFIEDYEETEPHALSHSLGGANGRPEAVPNQAAMGRYFATQVASLLSALDVEEDPLTGRTFLDNTLVLWTNDMGSVSNHSGARMPLAMFGGQGLLKQGQYVDLRSPYSRVWTWRDWLPEHSPGLVYNRLLETVAQTFGLTPAQYEQTGEAGFGPYPTPPSYFYLAFPGEEAEYVEYAHGDRRSPVMELFEDGAELP